MLNKYIINITLGLIIFLLQLNRMQAKEYNKGIIFYNPITRAEILPPFVKPIISNKSSLRIGLPCSCKDQDCGCCAGLNIQQYNFDQKLCANVSFDSSILGIKMFVSLNDRNIMQTTFAAGNPPPLCYPIMLPIPIALCLKFTNMQFNDYNVHFCMDWVVRMGSSNDIFEMHFNCVQMGQGGFHYIDQSGMPVFPQNGNGVLFISSLFGVTTQKPITVESSSEGTEDIFDPVDFDGRILKKKIK